MMVVVMTRRMTDAEATAMWLWQSSQSSPYSRR